MRTDSELCSSAWNLMILELRSPQVISWLFVPFDGNDPFIDEHFTFTFYFSGQKMCFRKCLSGLRHMAVNLSHHFYLHSQSLVNLMSRKSPVACIPNLYHIIFNLNRPRLCVQDHVIRYYKKRQYFCWHQKIHSCLLARCEVTGADYVLLKKRPNHYWSAFCTDRVWYSAPCQTSH